MEDFMLDRGFLQELNRYRVKRYSAAITLLDFTTEYPITRFEANVVNGSMSISAKSATRRTGSLQVIFDKDLLDLTNPDSLLSINKKISLSIGIKNPFYSSPDYRKYGETLWFKQGIFIITAATSSFSATSQTVNLQFIDKMGVLNGTCGGTLPAQVSFHERIIIDPNDNYTIQYPRIRQIIAEAVNHFGGEHPSKIIIDDVPDFGRQVVTWNGSTPAWFAENSGAFVVSEASPPNFPEQKILGDDIGYMSTELTFPGELILKAGSTVTSLLDEIVKALGNYEYFYDVDGYFHFQQIKNFDKTGVVPVGEITSAFNILEEQGAAFQSQYLPKYQADQFLNEFTDTDLVSQVSYNPQYANIKNDFIVWGSRKSGTSERLVRYHLAIDTKPKADPLTSLCYKNIWAVRSAATKEIHRYFAIQFAGIPSLGESGNLIVGNVTYQGEYNPTVTYKYAGLPDSVLYNGEYYAVQHTQATQLGFSNISPDNIQYWQKIEPTAEELLLHSPSLSRLPDSSFNWREELYRRALLAYNSSGEGSYYDEELLAEWRHIFNPCDKQLDPWSELGNHTNPYWSDFKPLWEEYFTGESVPWGGYNVDVIRSPQKISYWLDLIDTNSRLGAYSVPRIGRRTIVKENNQINEVLNREIPDVVFIDGTGPPDVIELSEQENISIGQKYCIVKADYLPYFKIRNSFGTCYEEIRDLLYNHLIYNTSASLTCIPLLYLDVNKVIKINFPNLKINGNFVINTISWQLNNMATMTLQLNEAIVIV